MTFAQIQHAEDRREDILTCPCGEIASHEVRRRDTVQAILCGPGACSTEVAGKVWA
jgi:hypothetical protein